MATIPSERITDVVATWIAGIWNNPNYVDEGTEIPEADLDEKEGAISWNGVLQALKDINSIFNGATSVPAIKGRVQILREMPTGSNAAKSDTRGGGSTPAEDIEVSDFDDDTQEYRDFLIRLCVYTGNGLTIRLVWSAFSATSNDVVWGAAIRRIADDAEDIDTSHTYLFNTTTATAPTVSGEVSYDSITFTDGADMDNIADGEIGILRITRVAADGGDTMVGDAELWFVTGEET